MRRGRNLDAALGAGLQETWEWRVAGSKPHMMPLSRFTSIVFCILVRSFFEQSQSHEQDRLSKQSINYRQLRCKVQLQQLQRSSQSGIQHTNPSNRNHAEHPREAEAQALNARQEP